MPIVWPSGTVPETQSIGVLDSKDEATLVSKMDNGSFKVRRKTRSPRRFMTWEYEVYGNEREALETFFDTTLLNGSLEFNMEDAIKETTLAWRFVKRPTFRLAARITSEDSILLVTITHDDISTIRLARDREDIVSGGDTYTAWDFDVSLPQERADRTVQTQITFDNTNHLFTPIIRAITGFAKVTLEVVSASDRDTIQVTSPSFYLVNAQFSANRVTGRLSMQPLSGEPFPGDSITPRLFPGAF